LRPEKLLNTDTKRKKAGRNKAGKKGDIV